MADDLIAPEVGTAWAVANKINVHDSIECRCPWCESVARALLLAKAEGVALHGDMEYLRERAAALRRAAKELDRGD